jgi:hypothetical protein
MQNKTIAIRVAIAKRRGAMPRSLSLLVAVPTFGNVKKPLPI